MDQALTTQVDQRTWIRQPGQHQNPVLGLKALADTAQMGPRTWARRQGPSTYPDLVANGHGSYQAGRPKDLSKVIPVPTDLTPKTYEPVLHHACRPTYPGQGTQTLHDDLFPELTDMAPTALPTTLAWLISACH